MKKLLLLSMIIVSGMFYESANAQIRISAQININSQPEWGPAGYNYAQYYYLPDANMYYDIAAGEYVYFDRGRWLNTRVLPSYLKNIDLYRSYKVVINDRTPWMHNDRYRQQYAISRNRPQQMNWRDSRREVVRTDHRYGNYGTPDRNGHNDHERGNFRH